MTRNKCQSSSLDLDSLTIDLSCILLPDTLTFIFCHSFTFIRYAKSYADLNSNSISFQNKRVNNLVCLSFMDKIKSQIFTLKIKKTDENKEVNYVQSV